MLGAPKTNFPNKGESYNVTWREAVPTEGMSEDLNSTWNGKPLFKRRSEKEEDKNVKYVCCQCSNMNYDPRHWIGDKPIHPGCLEAYFAEQEK